MRKILTTYLALATLGGALLAPTVPAHADSAGPAIAAGIGGLALGALASGAFAQPAPPSYYYAPPPAPVYVQRPPRCWREQRPVFDEYGEVIGYRPRRVCE